MPAVAARPILRSPALRFAARRYQSTSTQKAADKATEVAKDTATKASQGLSRVTSAAGPAIAGAAKGMSASLGKLGGRTGKLVAFIERTISEAHQPDKGNAKGWQMLT